MVQETRFSYNDIFFHFFTHFVVEDTGSKLR